MAENKRRRKHSSPEENYRTGVLPPQLLPFEEHIDYEFHFEQNMRMLEENLDRPYDAQVTEAWNCAWDNLLRLKSKWLFHQNCASLALPTPCGTMGQIPTWDGYGLRDKFQRMYAYAEQFPNSIDSRMHLIKESMVAEWPRSFTPFSDGGDAKSVTVDRAPILRMSIKAAHARVRRWHPTVQLSVLALNKKTTNIIRARFIAQLVTQKSDKVEYQPWSPVGRLILTEREGEANATIVTKGVRAEGSVLVVDCGYNGQGVPQFDNNGTLCAQFTDLGTDTGEKKKSTVRQRYCIEIISELLFADGLELKNSTLSHPFLIVANNEQNKTVLGDITWDILTAEPGNINIPPNQRPVTWKKLMLMLKHYVQSQLIEARDLDNEELLHLQCMLFLPLAVGHKKSQQELEILERNLFGFIRTDTNKHGIKKIKYRLLREFVLDHFLIDQQQFLTNKCIDLKDCVTELQHSVWDWLFEAVEVITDRNNASLLCEDVSQTRPKKDRKSSMMLKLFNDKLITMSSRERVWKVFKMLSLYDSKNHRVQQTLAMLIRFSESETGSLSFAYSNLEGSELKPTYGSMTAKEIKQIRNGLIGMLMEAQWPAKFDRLVRFDNGKGEGKGGASFPNKQQVFAGYEPPKATHSPQFESSEIDPFKIDPLRGPVVHNYGYQSPLYVDSASYPTSPPSSFVPDLFGKGEDIRHAVEQSGLGAEFSALSVSTADSRGARL